MAVNLSPVGGAAAQFFTNTGAVLTGGKLYTYLAGTTTPATTYTTSAGNVARTNPIILDAAGRVPGSGEIWLTVGLTYKFVLKDSNDVLIGTYDNIPSGSITDSSLVLYTPAGTGAVTTTVQTKLRENVSVKDFGAVGDGVTNDTAAWNLAIAYCTANSLCLYAPSVGSYYNIASNITISCAFSAGLYRVFGGTGVVKFGRIITSVNPEWWGASATSDSTAAIISAINSFSTTNNFPDSTSSKLIIFSQFYQVNSPVVIPPETLGLTFQGTGWSGSGLYVNHSGHGFIADTAANPLTICDMKIEAASPNTSTGSGIYIPAFDAGTYLFHAVFKNLWMEGFKSGSAFYLTQLVCPYFNNLYINNCRYGIRATGLCFAGKVDFMETYVNDIAILFEGSSDVICWEFNSVAVNRGNYGFYFNQATADIRISTPYFEDVAIAGVQTDSGKNHFNYTIDNGRFIFNPLCTAFLFNNLSGAVLTNNNFSSCAQDIVLGNSNGLFCIGNTHVNADQSKWLINNTPANQNIVFQTTNTTTTRNGDLIAYVPSYAASVGLALKTRGNNGTGAISGDIVFGDGSGWKTRFRNNATPAVELAYITDTGDFALQVAGKGLILKNAAGTVEKRITLNDTGDGFVFSSV
jgi:hypothetical protein